MAKLPAEIQIDAGTWQDRFRLGDFLTQRLANLFSDLRDCRWHLKLILQFGAHSGTAVDLFGPSKYSFLSTQKAVATSPTVVDLESSLTCFKRSVRAYLDRPIGFLEVICTNRDKKIVAQLADLFVESLSSAAQLQKLAFATDTIAATKAEASQRDSVNFRDLIARTRLATGSIAVVLWQPLDRANSLPFGARSVAVEYDRSRVPLTPTLSTPSPLHLDMPGGVGVAGYCFESCKTIRIDNLLDDDEVLRKTGRKVFHREFVRNSGWRSGAFIPLAAGSQVFGVLGAYGRRTKGFNDLDERICTLCAERLLSLLAVQRNEYYRAKQIMDLENVGLELVASRYSLSGKIHDISHMATAIKDAMHVLINRDDSAVRSELRLQYEKMKNLDHKITSARDEYSRRKIQTLTPTKVRVDRLLIEFRNREKFRTDLERIELSVSCPEGLTIVTDVILLEAALFNLLENSIRHFGFVKKRDKTIVISVTDIGNGIAIAFEDNGQGIAAENLPRICEPFFSTVEGTGLGLALVEKFVNDSGGTMSIDSSWGKFTRFTLLFPDAKSHRSLG